MIPERLQRMADLARWVTAAEPALGWPEGSFMEAYIANQAVAVEATIEADPVAQAIRDLMVNRRHWRDTASELLRVLEVKVSELVVRSKAWPKSASALSNRLLRAKPSLRAVGIEVETGIRQGQNRTRMIEIRKRV